MNRVTLAKKTNAVRLNYRDFPGSLIHFYFD